MGETTFFSSNLPRRDLLSFCFVKVVETETHRDWAKVVETETFSHNFALNYFTKLAFILEIDHHEYLILILIIFLF